MMVLCLCVNVVLKGIHFSLIALAKEHTDIPGAGYEFISRTNGQPC